MPDLVIVGAGGHGRETLDIVEAINEVAPTWSFLGFLDDGQVASDRLERRSAPLLGPTGALATIDAAFVVGIGLPLVRAAVAERLVDIDRPAATLIHPTATVASDNRIDAGTLIAAGARVTTNVTLGRHVHLNVNAVVSHDSVVGDYSSLAPGATVNGDVTLGRCVFLGTGAIVTPGCSIGDNAVVGAGAVIVADVPPGVTVKGVPGRR